MGVSVLCLPVGWQVLRRGDDEVAVRARGGREEPNKWLLHYLV